MIGSEQVVIVHRTSDALATSFMAALGRGQVGMVCVTSAKRVGGRCAVLGLFMSGAVR